MLNKRRDPFSSDNEFQSYLLPLKLYIRNDGQGRARDLLTCERAKERNGREKKKAIRESGLPTTVPQHVMFFPASPCLLFLFSSLISPCSLFILVTLLHA